jgi:hypothetical protein
MDTPKRYHQNNGKPTTDPPAAPAPAGNPRGVVDVFRSAVLHVEAVDSILSALTRQANSGSGATALAAVGAVQKVKAAIGVLAHSWRIRTGR